MTTDTFNGMIYPKGLSKNSTCMTEYIQQEVSWVRLMSHNVMQCHDTVTCCDALLRLTGRGSFPVSRIFSSKRTILKMSFNPAHNFRVWSATPCRWGRATPCPLTWWRGWSTSTPWWCSPTGSWWPTRVGDITWGADTRPRRNSCRMTSTWGELQRLVWWPIWIIAKMLTPRS